MALEVEDGTGLTESNAYVENDYVTDYHVARGGADNLAWTAATTLQKDNAIVRACTYLDIRFGRKFIGTKLTLEQAMEWPRANAIDLDGFQSTDENMINLL